MLNHLIHFFLERRLVTLLLLAMLVVAGVMVSPFKMASFLPHEPVRVDAIPDIGENQQIVSVPWAGRSPQDVENQITYPLSTALMGIPGVQSIRSSSMFGLSSISVIFEEGTEFYWSRSRLLEKLNALPPDLLPEGVRPSLGPDATAIGQVFWYTLEPKTDTLDPQELRRIQDYTVRWALSAVEGVSEVASIGGYIREYQIDLDPARMASRGITLNQVAKAIQNASQESGAGTLEYNRVEYFIRGLGFVNSVADLEQSIVANHGETPIRIQDIASVRMGPTMQRGTLDKNGYEAVGGVVVSRHGANPMEVIQRIKSKIKEIEPSLPVHIVPFYDRSGLIEETLLTLREAIVLQILIAILVVVAMVQKAGPAALISILLPIAVLMSFLAMKFFEIEANIVSLAGIAIAIGTLVDLGIIVTENMVARQEREPVGTPTLKIVSESVKEVSLPIVTALSTTVIGFLPVFALQEAEGKLFKPLAYTKSFALIAALLLTLFVLPTLATFFMARKNKATLSNSGITGALLVILTLLIILWKPIGEGYGVMGNAVAVILFCGVPLLTIYGMLHVYPYVLKKLLAHQRLFWVLPVMVILSGIWSWQCLGSEFMPALDEGAFLLMPIAMPHAGVTESRETLRQLDMAVQSIPEVQHVVGKMGRVESALDPAPINMFENLIVYKPEFGLDSNGNRVRLWRDHIKSPNDIWNEITNVTRIVGVTSAPKLQPIETRQVMLQTGMRSPFGIKVLGNHLPTMESFGLDLEKVLRRIPAIREGSVYAERTGAKPYIEIHPHRQKQARYGISMAAFHQTVESVMGGMPLNTTIEGRERIPIRMRWPRELRDSPEDLERIWLDGANGQAVPLGLVADIRYTNGPENIRSENGFLVSYVTFDGNPDLDMGQVAHDVQDSIEKSISRGELRLPPEVRYYLSGTYENQIRAQERLMFVVPLVLVVIFLILYLQFRKVALTLMVFSGIACAFAGGFITLTLWPSSLNLSVAVWVGFIALFGIATDDGVVMLTYLEQKYHESKPQSISEIRNVVLEAGLRRIRPCLMTTATTIIALLPVLTSTGRGADLMKPMAIPIFGGMIMELLTLFIVPLLYAAWREFQWTNVQQKWLPSFTGALSVIPLAFVFTTQPIFANDTLSIDRIETLFEQIDNNNMELKSFEKSSQAWAQKAKGSAIVWDPEFRINHTTNLGSHSITTDTRLGVIQTIPWPGLRHANSQRQLEGAQQALSLSHEKKRKIYSQAILVFTTAQEQQRLRLLYDSLESHFNTQHQIIESQLEFENSYINLLQLKKQISVIQSIQNQIQSDYHITLTRLNELMSRDPQKPLSVKPSPIRNTTTNTEYSPHPSWDQHPAIQTLDNQVSMIHHQQKALRYQKKPLLMGGIDFAIEKQMVMPMMGITVPLFSRSTTWEQKALQSEKESIQAQALHQKIVLAQEFKVNEWEWMNLENQLNAIHTQYGLVVEVSQILTQRLVLGTARFEDWLDTEIQRLELLSKRYTLQIQKAKLMANHYYLTGEFL